MNLQHLFLIFLLIGLMSDAILLVFPKLNYLAKGVFVSLIGGLWIYLSINFVAINFIYIANDRHGIFLLLAAIYGIGVSVLAGSLIMVFFIEKKKLRDRSNKKI